MKILVAEYPAGEVMFARGILSTALFAIVLATTGKSPAFSVLLQPLPATRVVLDTLTTVAGTISLIGLGVAELASIVLASPLLISLLGVLIYKEMVGWRRWTAIFVGFAGILVILRPDAHAVNMFALFALLAAIFASTRDVITRRVSQDIPIAGLIAASTFLLSIAGGILGYRENWKMFSSSAWSFLVAATLFHGAGTYLLITAFRGAAVSVVSPFRYTFLLWSGLAGYLVFGDIPAQTFYIGAALVVGSGLYLLHREALARRSMTKPGSPP
jgi:drug/metabolite transporter (DMT)-like permease